MTDKNLIPLDAEPGADLDFLQEKFAQDGLQIPETLSEDAIRQKLASASAAEPAVARTGAAHTAAARNAADEHTDAHTGAEERAAAHTDATHTAASSSPAPQPKRRWRRQLIGLAACVALVIALIPAMQAILPDQADNPSSAGPSADSEMPADANGLFQFHSYAELDQKMSSLLPEEDYTTYSSPVFEAQEDMAMADAESEAGAAEGYAADGGSNEATLGDNGDAPAFAERDAAKGSDGGESAAGLGNANSDSAATGSDSASKTDDPQHSSTYTQVEGIDEADIVKTDGRYIYFLSSLENQIIIAKASKGKAKRVSAVPGSKEGSYIDDIFIRDDQLIVISSGDCIRTGSKGLMAETTIVTVYDISDRNNPQQLSSYSQTGNLLSSRLIDDRLILVTNDIIYSYAKGSSLPYVSYDEGTPRRLPIGNISCFPQVNNASFTVIGMFDLSSGKASKDTVKTKAVLGGSNEIYCNGTSLYVTGTITGTGIDGAGIDGAANGNSGILSSSYDEYDPALWQQQTQILKVSLDGGKVKYRDSAIVNGIVNNQFSMDERGGNFRIATTSQHDGEDVNNLYILDSKMKQIGACVGFARDEHIEAVRYIKDKAYVITYRQTDPLFIIDLSDPAQPSIEGHVKISGFSTLLVPSDADHLLGLGFSTEENEFGEATDGVKLALFDISDPSHPKVADSESFSGMGSAVQYDHKALLVGPDADYYAIPYEITPQVRIDEDVILDDGMDVIIEDAEEPAAIEESTEEAAQSDVATEEPSEKDLKVSRKNEIPEGTGILVFSAKAGKLRVLHNLRTDEQVQRCIYIDDYIYGICRDDSIVGFRLGSDK